MTWRELAPCGACGLAVSRDRGCEHWRPQLSNAGRGLPPIAPNERSRRYRERKRAALVQAPEVESSEVVAEHRRIMLIKEV